LICGRNPNSLKNKNGEERIKKLYKSVRITMGIKTAHQQMYYNNNGIENHEDGRKDKNFSKKILDKNL